MKILTNHERIISMEENNSLAMKQMLDDEISKLKMEIITIKAEHAEEKNILRRDAKDARMQYEELANNITLSETEGDIIFAGSWLQLPMGWNGRLALDLRVFRIVFDLTWSMLLNKLPSATKQFNLHFWSSRHIVLGSMDNLRISCLKVFYAVQDLVIVAVKWLSILFMDVVGIIYRWREFVITAVLESKRRVLMPYLKNILNLGSKLYKNEFVQLYIASYDLLYVNVIQPVYIDNFLPFFAENIHPILNNVPEIYSVVMNSAI